MTIRVAVIQMDSGTDWETNIQCLEHSVAAAAANGAKFIVSPEYTDIRGDSSLIKRHASPLNGALVARLAKLAKAHACYLHVGSIHEQVAEQGKLANTGLTFSPEGALLARYRKVHLYDAVVNGLPYKESDDFAHGDTLQVVDMLGMRVGLSICYDIRFPELFRSLRARGANVIVVPAAFNVHTGRDHWELLLRARAVENQCYVIAAAQIGGPGPALPCLGRSMVIDPWGTVVACMPDVTGHMCADISLERIQNLRAKLPAWEHRRTDLYLTSDMPQTDEFPSKA